MRGKRESENEREREREQKVRRDGERCRRVRREGGGGGERREGAITSSNLSIGL